MNRCEAVDAIYAGIKNEDAVVSTTGLTSREIYKKHDSKQNFYMVGSMGLASSIGLGIAMNNRNKDIVVVEGDASLLMNLGSLATIGNESPENFVHIVLDNQAYGSCSGEPSASKKINLAVLAKESGYKQVFSVSTDDELTKAIQTKGGKKGPMFILAKINLDGSRDLPRPLDLPLITKRFKHFLNPELRREEEVRERIIVMAESQEKETLTNRFRQVLKTISTLDIENFKGIGIVLYDCRILNGSIHTNTRSKDLLSKKPNIFDEDCINFLCDVTKWDNPYHDGFIFVNENGQITDVAQYFVPPVVPGILPNESAGIRFHSALYGSFVTGIIATGVVSSKKEAFFFKNGLSLE